MAESTYRESVNIPEDAHRVELRLIAIPRADGVVTIVSMGAEVIPGSLVGPDGKVTMNIRELSQTEKLLLCLDYMRSAIPAETGAGG